MKLFPAELLTPPVLKALRAVFRPRCCSCRWAASLRTTWRPTWPRAPAASASGSALYKPGMTVAQVKANAQAFVLASREVHADGPGEVA